MAPSTVNVLLTSFPGLGLPPTLSIPVLETMTITELWEKILRRSSLLDRLVLTTVSSSYLDPFSSAPISSLLSSPQDDFVSLRISARLCGGKGGFGSQLRAAGGRMSSKRKRNQGENNGSSRNLDGRRLRTVTEAKALAEYLAIKPEMEKKEKDERRKRWEQVIELAERREEEIRSGSKGKVDGKWVEDKEEAGERTREAVLAAMKSGNYKDNLYSTSSRSARMVPESGSSGSDHEDIERSSSKGTTPPSDIDEHKLKAKKFFGFDEDDDFMSDDEENEVDEGETVERESSSEDDEDEGLKEPSPVPEKVVENSKSKRITRSKAAAKGKGVDRSGQ